MILNTHNVPRGTLTLTLRDTETQLGVVFSWASKTIPMPPVETTVAHEKPITDPLLREQLIRWAQNLSPENLDTLAQKHDDGMSSLWANMTQTQRDIFETLKTIQTLLTP